MQRESVALSSLADSFGSVVEGSNLLGLDNEQVQDLFREHGALVFRGFDASVDDFVAFSKRFCSDFSDYQGGGFRFGSFDRDSVGDDKTVMTTTGGTQGFPIPLHGEYYYSTQVPDILWFYCERPSPTGGQTTVGDGYQLFSRLKPATQSFFETQPIRYRRELPDGVWQQSFMTEDLDELRRACETMGTELDVDEASGTVRTDYVCSALRSDRRPGEVAFINNVLPIHYGEIAIESGWVKRELGDATPKSPIVVRDADGERLPKDIVEDLWRAAEEVTSEIEWSPGDLAMVDNTWVLHGRREAEGEGRSVLVRMGASAFPLA